MCIETENNRCRSAIDISRLCAYYDGKQVLKDIDLSFGRNRITAIIGPSGCGKSTLLRCINGLLWEEQGAGFEGSVLLDGVQTEKLPREELRRRVGMVSQTPAPFPFSILKNMTYAPKYYGVHGKDELMRLAVEKLKLAGLYEEVGEDLRKSALKLSGGQQQRLCIARALTSDPEVLLLDEPCSALDVKSSAVIEEMLLNLKEHYTIVVVTHNIAQARRITDEVVFLYEGRVVEQGTAESIFGNPQQAETRDFLSGVMG